MPESQHKNIVYFDGVCGLCNSFVSFLLKRNQKAKLHFCSIQSAYAKNKLEPLAIEYNDTIVFETTEGIYTHSDAAIRIFLELGGAWNLLKLVKLIPKSLRDFGYRWIAKNRYKFFGKLDHCRVPSADERSIFIE